MDFAEKDKERNLAFALTPTRSRAAANSASFSRRAREFLGEFAFPFASSVRRFSGCEVGFTHFFKQMVAAESPIDLISML